MLHYPSQQILLATAGLTLILTSAACRKAKPYVPPYVPATTQVAAPVGAASVQRDVPPASFQRATTNTWHRIPLRQGLKAEDAYNRMRSILIDQTYRIDSQDRNSYYARTHWNNTVYVNNRPYERYRTRVLFRVNPEQQEVRIQIEAQYDETGKGQWVQGTDTDVLRNLETDIVGSIGI